MTTSPLRDPNFLRAQRAYDAQMPPEEEGENGECRHKWKRIPGEASDGTRFVRCVKCGEEDEA